MLCMLQGNLQDFRGGNTWQIEDLVGDLSVVESLDGKPKILIIQACRGGQYSLSTHSVLSTHHTGLQGR